MTPTAATSENTGFLDDDFLLTTQLSRQLFHDIAADLSIVDVHNHLSPAEIATDHRWETITDLWLGEDHYKWRAMRHAGHAEERIVGPADPWERFEAWAATLPRLIGNPLYVWTHLELRRTFDIDLPLNPATASEIWDETNRQLASLSAQQLLRHFNVELVATTDDPTSDLAHHQSYATGSALPAMVPTLRPDAAHALLDDTEAWNGWADRLESASGVSVTDLASLLDALSATHERFAALGARASDHGLARLPDLARDPSAADSAIRSARSGLAATAQQKDLVLLEVVAHIAALAVADDSVLQLHLGPLRNVSPRLLDSFGPDAGADVMGDEPQAAGLARFLGDLERNDSLPRVVLYNLNPADNELFATMAGAFARPGVASLVQWGPPWWFNDHERGMRAQLDTMGEIGQLASFIGMLTDSRSILSMTRHELFRRVLCAKLGDDVNAGRFPHDIDWLATVVRDICVNNTRAHFGF